MNLEPRAKPVRFYIESGGVEHYSLKSLREHFVLKDVLSLMDGRFERWLNLIGEKDKASALVSDAKSSVSKTGCSGSDIDNSEEQCLALLNLVFDREWDSLYHAYIQLHAQHEWIGEDYPHLSISIKCCSTTDLIEDYYKHRIAQSIPLANIFKTELECRSNREDEIALYQAGLLLYNGEDESLKKIGIKFLRSAAISGCYEAKEFFSQRGLILSLLDAIRRNKCNKKLKPYEYDNHLKQLLSIRLRGFVRFCGDIKEAPEIEKIFSDFYRVCLKALKDNYSAKVIIEKAFTGANPKETLGEEKLFLLAKATGNRLIYCEILEYGPARSVLYDNKCCGLSFKWMTLRNSIETILLRLFDLSADGRENHY